MTIKDGRRQVHDLGPARAGRLGAKGILTGQAHSHGGAAVETLPCGSRPLEYALGRVVRAADNAIGIPTRRAL